MRKIGFSSLLILITFFASGCAALIYQLVWQRYLFTGLGVDIDSVTVIVSTFMLGIGIGGALGGWLADHLPTKKLKMYALAELVLAVIGLCSPWIFGKIQLLSILGWSYPAVSGIAVSVVLVPTVIMGTTLPLLTMYFDEALANVGVSVGILYFVNTLGAAGGAALVSHVLFMGWGLDASTRLAALINISCCVCTLIAASFVRKFAGKPHCKSEGILE